MTDTPPKRIWVEQCICRVDIDGGSTAWAEQDLDDGWDGIEYVLASEPDHSKIIDLLTAELINLATEVDEWRQKHDAMAGELERLRAMSDRQGYAETLQEPRNIRAQSSRRKTPNT